MFPIVISKSQLFLKSCLFALGVPSLKLIVPEHRRSFILLLNKKRWSKLSQLRSNQISLGLQAQCWIVVFAGWGTSVQFCQVFSLQIYFSRVKLWKKYCKFLLVHPGLDFWELTGNWHLSSRGLQESIASHTDSGNKNSKLNLLNWDMPCSPLSYWHIVDVSSLLWSQSPLLCIPAHRSTRRPPKGHWVKSISWS